jgi:hypothetical protein
MTDIAQPQKRKSYSTAAMVKARYGGRSDMWLWRKLKMDPTFPRPMVTPNSHLRLWDDDQLDDYDEACMAASNPTEAHA